jgi:hypothetical protein
MSSPERVRLEKQIKLAQIRFLEEAIQSQEEEICALEEAENHFDETNPNHSMAHTRRKKIFGAIRSTKLEPKFELQRETACQPEQRRDTIFWSFIIGGILFAIFLTIGAALRT